MLFFADRGERAVVQGMLIGSVIAVMAALMLLLHGLDDPFHDGVGGLQPVAMERSLRIDRRGAERDRRQGAAPVRRGRASRWPVTAADARRDAIELVGDRAARGRDGRDRLERLPVDPLERRAGEGGRPRERAADRVGQGGRARERPDQVDVATFTQWVNAYALEQTELADFYFKRFRPEFKPAVDAWIATRPLKNPSAPPTPFAMPQYRAGGARGRPSGSTRQAGASPPRCCRDIQRASNYVLGVVLFAVGAVLRGHEHQADLAGLRVAMLAIGCTIFLVTVVWIATSPVSISV